MSTNSPEQPRWLTPFEDRAWRGYRRMRTLLDLQLARDLADDSGLSDSDYHVLSTLSEREGARWRLGDLADQLLWSTSRLAHHAKRMQARGLVRRDQCGDDGRGATLSITEAGWTTLRTAAPWHVRSVRTHFLDLLTPAEIESLASISEKVIRHLASTTDEQTDAKTPV